MNLGKLKNQRLPYIVEGQLQIRDIKDARDVRVVIRRQSNAATVRRKAIMTTAAG